MKKVCILTTVHISNDVRVYHKEVKSLVKKYKVTYVAVNTDLVSSDDGNIKFVNYKRIENRLNRIFNFVNVWRLCVKQKCDIYHLQDPELIIVGLLLKIFNRKKIIYDVHEDYPDHILQKEYLNKYVKPILSKLMKLMEVIAGKAFDYIITADDEVIKRFPEKKSTVIYNFPELNVFKLNSKDTLKKYDIIFHGTVTKRIATIILNITKEVIKSKRDFKVLLICGNLSTKGITFEWVKKEMQSMQIPFDTIELKGRVPYSEISSYIQESKIGIIPLPNTPKFQKNIPTKLFEFMYCKVPIVASDLYPIRKFVDGHDYCMLVNIENYDESSKVIIKLLNNEKMLNQMGEKGKELVDNVYNWSNEEAKLFNIYKSLLKD